MKRIEAIKQLPCKVFANQVFHIATKVCKTEAEFEKFLEGEINPEVEPGLKRALQEVQCSSED